MEIELATSSGALYEGRCRELGRKFSMIHMILVTAVNEWVYITIYIYIYSIINIFGITPVRDERVNNIN